MITSTKNDQVKAVIELKKKARARNEQGLFVVEGVRMAAELPKDQVKSTKRFSANGDQKLQVWHLFHLF